MIASMTVVDEPASIDIIQARDTNLISKKFLYFLIQGLLRIQKHVARYVFQLFRKDIAERDPHIDSRFLLSGKKPVYIMFFFQSCETSNKTHFLCPSFGVDCNKQTYKYLIRSSKIKWQELSVGNVGVAVVVDDVEVQKDVIIVGGCDTQDDRISWVTVRGTDYNEHAHHYVCFSCQRGTKPGKR